MDKRTKISIFEIILFCAALYIIGQASFVGGMLKERNSKVCVDPYSLKLYEDNSHSSLSIVKLAFEQKQEQLSNCEKEIKKWKDNYLWLKSKPADPATSTAAKL